MILKKLNLHLCHLNIKQSAKKINIKKINKFSINLLINFIILLLILDNKVYAQINNNEQNETNFLLHDLLDNYDYIPKSDELEFSNQLYLAIIENFSISLFKYNEFYTDLYYIGAINKEPDSIIYIYDENNNVVSQFPFYNDQINIIPFNSNYNKIQIENNIIELTFCNYNGICENNNKNLLENNIICEDCEKSTQDNFCDTSLDNKCDPDCNNLDYDCECPFCNYSYEHYPDEVPETCDLFSGRICSSEQICTGSFINVSDTDRCCIKGICIQKQSEKQKLEIYFLLAFIFLIILIVLLIYIFRKKKLITISIIFLLILSFNINAEQPLSRDQVIEKICEITQLYREKTGIPIPSSFVLGFAQTETRLMHWDIKGNVKVSGDNGVGIMQITGNLDNRGFSIKDGHKLNVYNFEDNIEAGILEIINKCKSLNCMNPNSEKLYYCKNYRLLPEKKVIYRGWELAIRAYNGWGCNAPIFRDQWIQKSGGNINIFKECMDEYNNMDTCLERSGINFKIFHSGFDDSNPYDGYGPIAARIQNYVDLVYENAKKFEEQKACKNDIPLQSISTAQKTSNSEDNKKEESKTQKTDELTEIKYIINKNGYYYLDNIIKTEINFNTNKIEELLDFISEKLLKETYNCVFDLQYDCKSQNKNNVCFDENNDLKFCQSNDELLKCKNPDKTFRECALSIIKKNNIKNLYLDFCPSDIEEKECYDKGDIYDGKECVKKTSYYDEHNVLKFCYETGQKYPYFDKEKNKYLLKNLNLKFSLLFNKDFLTFNYDKFSYDQIEDLTKTSNNLEKVEYVKNNIEQEIKTPYLYKSTTPLYYKDLFNDIKSKLGGTLPLYTDCTEDISKYAWCWVHNGCHGFGIYCKKDKLEKASQSYLAQLFVHEITHNLQAGRCSNRVESEWGAEYYSGSQYYCFKVGNNWLKATQVAQIMKHNGCSDSQLIDTAFCRNKCNNPAIDVKGTAYQKC